MKKIKKNAIRSKKSLTGRKKYSASTYLEIDLKKKNKYLTLPELQKKGKKLVLKKDKNVAE